MGFAFLTPLFLLGLLSVAVPLLIHLYRREKSQVVAFPSLMFLQRIPYRSVRQQRIRHWLLLLLRAAALVLLAVAFARPLLESRVAASPGVESRRDVVILIDRSFSMTYGDRWQRARSAAREAVASLGENDRASLVAFDERVEALTRPTSDVTRLGAVLDGLEPGAGATRLAPALRLARRLLVDSDLPRREVVLISDLQRTAWSGSEGVRLPRGTELVQVDLSERAAANLAVASVSLDRSSGGERQRVEISARIISRGGEAFPAVPLRLELDGRTVESKEVSLGANGSVSVAFDPVTVGSEDLTRGAVRIEGDALDVDNTFLFVLSPAQGISALIVQGSGGGRAESLYLERALELGQRPFFRVERQGARELGERDLAGRDVVIVNDAGDMPAPATEALAAFVERGGGLWLALGRSSTGGGAASLARRFGRTGSVVDRTREWGGSLAFLDYTHPMLELFSGPRSGDFGSARFFRYHDLSGLETSAAPTPADDENVAAGSRRVLARFDDGKPALVEVPWGEGRVMVWASGLDTLWNNLPLQPVFLPLVHRVTSYLAAYEPPREWYTVGQVTELTRTAGGDEEWLVLAPSGEQRTVDVASEPLVPLDEQGFYEVRPVGGAPAGAETGDEDERLTIAVNVDVAESDLTPLDAEELALAIRPIDGEETAGTESAATPVEREEKQRLWWYLLLAVLLLLAVETALSNRLSLGRAGGGSAE